MTQSHPKIGLLHHVGGGNLGDDATLRAVADNITQRSPKAEIIAFSMNPNDTETRHGIVSHPIHRKGWTIGYNKPDGNKDYLTNAVRRLTRRYAPASYLYKAAKAIIRTPGEWIREASFLMSSRRKVASLDLLIICGGGQLTEKDGPWGFPYTILKWVLLARLEGVKCIFLNVGAGPLTHPFSKSLVRWALLTAAYVSLRDSQSRALLHEIGFTGECYVYPDSAYSLDVATPDKTLTEANAQLTVGIAPMPYPGPRAYLADRDQVNYDEFIQSLAEFASYLSGQSYAITTFGTDIGVDPPAIQDFERAFANCIGSAASEYSDNRSVASVDDVLAAISRMDYVITCRFHGVVFAHLLNKPVIAIAHHPKVMDLMSDLELSAYCVDIRNFDPSLLAQRFASMISNVNEIKRHMATRLQKNRCLLGSQFDELIQSLRPGPRETAETLSKITELYEHEAN